MKIIRFIVSICIPVFSIGMMGNPVSAQDQLLEKSIYLSSQTGTIQEILSLIANAGELTFSYSTNNIPIEKEVTIEEGPKPIKEFLDEIFRDVPVRYIEKSNKILLVKAKKPIYQSLRGMVTDSETKVPLIGAAVVIKDSEPLIGTITSPDGYFELKNIPLGRHDIQVSYLGYEIRTISQVLFGSANEITLDIPLVEYAYEVDEVQVNPNLNRSEPKNSFATVSARSFTVEETKRYAAAINDPSRMVLVYPGVTTGDEDASNEIVIRGNSPNYVLWRLEGIEIPNPNHFALEGTSAGFVNVLSSNLIDKSDFFTGAFPAEYGNALSGVFDLSMRTGNNQNHENSFQIGLLGADMTAEGPFSRNYNGSYLVNFRYSDLTLLKRLGLVIANDLLPAYWDISYKFHAPTKKFGDFSIWGIGGQGSAETDDSTKSDTLDVIKSRIMAFGVSHIYPVNDRSYLKSIISFSQNESLDEAYNDLKRFDHQSLKLSNIRGSTTYNLKVNQRTSLKSGIVLSHLKYNYYDERLNAGRYGQDTTGSTQVLQGFFQGKMKLTNYLALNGGIHFLYFNLGGQYSVEPRLGLKWNFVPGQAFGLGFGKHSRHEVLSTYFIQVIRFDTVTPSGKNLFTVPNRIMDLTKSLHAVLSYENNITKNLNFRSELYYQYLYDIPVKHERPFTQAPYNNEFPLDTFVNAGTGRNIGIEFILEKYFSDDYYFLVTSSWFDSKLDPGNDTLYHTRFNARFVNNLVAGKEFHIGRGQQDLMGVNAKLMWAGGKRGEQYINDSIRNPMHRWDRQYPDYFRIDFSLSYRMNRPKIAHIFSLDIQNVLNKENIGSINKEGEIRYLMGTIPIINYRLEF